MSSHPSEHAADLAALADGTLPAHRRAEVEAAVAADPELTRALAEQRAAVLAIRAAAPAAPARLRSHVNGLRAGRRRPRRTLVAGGLAAAGAAAAAVLLIALLPSGSTPGSPTVAQAAALGQRPALSVAPRPGRNGQLAASESGIPYPYWEDEYGWVASGVRGDRVAGRRVTTVFYARAGQRLAYSIVAGPALDPPGDARMSRGRRLVYRVFEDGGRRAVTWAQGGHTCVLSGVGIPARTLLRLAWWHDRPAA
jgi:hypothetical protein